MASGLLGAAGGGVLGHEVGGGGIGTVLGAVAGAVGANMFEKHEQKK